MKHIKKFNEQLEEEFSVENNNIDYIGSDQFDKLENLSEEIGLLLDDINVLINLIKNDKLEENKDLKKVVSDIIKINDKLDPFHSKLFDYLEKNE